MWEAIKYGLTEAAGVLIGCILLIAINRLGFLGRKSLLIKRLSLILLLLSGIFLLFYWFTIKESPFALKVKIENNEIKMFKISKSPFKLNLTKVSGKDDTLRYVDKKGNFYYFIKDKLINEKINEIDLIPENPIFYYHHTWMDGAEIVIVFKIANRWTVLTGFLDIFYFIIFFPGLYLLWNNGYKGKEPTIPDD